MPKRALRRALQRPRNIRPTLDMRNELLASCGSTIHGAPLPFAAAGYRRLSISQHPNGQMPWPSSLSSPSSRLRCLLSFLRLVALRWEHNSVHLPSCHLACQGSTCCAAFAATAVSPSDDWWEERIPPEIIYDLSASGRQAGQPSSPPSSLRRCLSYLFLSYSHAC